MNKHIATWNTARGVWETTQSNLFCEHSALYSAIWPTSGSMRNGQAFEHPMSALRIPGSESSSSRGLESEPDTGTLLRTPAAAEAEGGPRDRNRPGATMRLSDQIREEMEDGNISLLPTPVAQPSGNSPEEHLRKKPGRKVVTDLAILAENDLIRTGGLIPTPVTTDAKGARNATRNQQPGDTSHTGYTLTDVVALLPTPDAYAGDRGGARPVEERKAGNHSVTLQDVAVCGLPEQSTGATDWGKYTPAIRLWESLLDRPAPPPVRYDGRGGKARLNPELTEWMMGWRKGWVTDPRIGLSRNEQLRATGNGVVPQQAFLALRHLLSREGVPDVH